MRFKSCVLSIALIAMASGVALTGSSTALFSAQTANAAVFQGEADWAPPAVSLTDPGAVINGTVVVGAVAADDRSGVANLLFEYALASGGSWTAMCTADPVAPYSCSWNTSTVADGSYQLRATAVDVAGHSTQSSVVTTKVANAISVFLTDPGDNLSGTVPLQAALYNAPASTTLQIQFKKSTSSSWSNITGCSAVAKTLACSWNTGTNTDVYDIRAVAVVGTTTYADVAAGVQVDNTRPTVAIAKPLSPLSGVAILAATASDADSGIDRIQFDYAPNGTSAWAPACVTQSGSSSCPFNTTALVGGTYRFRAVSIDAAGNSSAASTVNNIDIDNVVATISLVNPGSPLSGTVTVAADANSGHGVTSVRIQRAVAGSSTFVDICTDASSPYTCAWNTTAVIDGSYDLRAIMLQGNGVSLTSAVVNVTALNNLLNGVDVQSVNGGATAGKLEAGDRITFTFSQQVSPASISAGWDGSTGKTVLARINDGRLVGNAANNDQFSVDSVNLGAVTLNANFVKNNQSVVVTSTMTIAAQVVNGVSRSVVTITFNQSPAGAQAASAATMTWMPSAAATNLAGQACSATVVTESGSIDKDF